MTQKKLSEHYNAEYYAGQVGGSLRSAECLLPILFDFYHPKSMADFGCGQGAWLKVAQDNGVVELDGYDGDWINQAQLSSQKVHFISTNFEEKIHPRRKYDLAISLEVAEHISEGRADDFIDTLTEASDVIVFGAAVKGQGGENHINEQWQSYWIEKFKQRSFVCVDIFRPRIWNDRRIEWWYRQNTFLFIKKSVFGNKIVVPKSVLMSGSLYDVVHPESFELRLQLLRDSEWEGKKKQGVEREEINASNENVRGSIVQNWLKSFF